MELVQHSLRHSRGYNVKNQRSHEFSSNKNVSISMESVIITACSDEEVTSAQGQSEEESVVPVYFQLDQYNDSLESALNSSCQEARDTFVMRPHALMSRALLVRYYLNVAIKDNVNYQISLGGNYLITSRKPTKYQFY